MIRGQQYNPSDCALTSVPQALVIDPTPLIFRIDQILHLLRNNQPTTNLISRALYKAAPHIPDPIQSFSSHLTSVEQKLTECYSGHPLRSVVASHMQAPQTQLQATISNGRCELTQG